MTVCDELVLIWHQSICNYGADFARSAFINGDQSNAVDTVPTDSLWLWCCNVAQFEKNPQI